MLIFHRFLSYFTKHRNLQNLWLKRLPNSYVLSSRLPESSQQPPSRLTGYSNQVSAWRAHLESYLESPFGEPIQRTTLEVDNSMDSMNQTPKKHPTIFQQAWLEPVLNLCFDKRNQSDQYLHVTYHNFSNQFCFLTGKILKIEFNFVFWQVKSK